MATPGMNPLPQGWMNQDIGASFSGTGTTYQNGQYTIIGKSTGNWLNTIDNDQFQFAYRPMIGDTTIIAHMPNPPTGTGSYAGIMIRGNLSTMAPFEAMLFPAADVPQFRFRRDIIGAERNVIAYNAPSIVGYPAWVKLERLYNAGTGVSTFKGYVSQDGTNWTQVHNWETYTSTAMLSVVYVGLVAATEVSSTTATGVLDEVTATDTADFYLTAPHTTQTLPTTGGTAHYPVVVNAINGFTGTVTLSGGNLPAGTTVNISPSSAGVLGASDVALTLASGATAGTYWFKLSGSSGGLAHTVDLGLTVVTPASNALPAGWSDQDVGGPFTGTGAAYTSGSFTVTGGSSNGRAIATGFQSPDEFHFVYQPIVGNATIIARLSSAPTGSGSPQVGVMFRTSLSATAPYAAMLLKDSTLTAVFRRRTTMADYSYDYTGSAIGAPGWVKLVRQYNASTQTSTFLAYASQNGTSWTQVGTSIDIPNTSSPVYVGLVSTTTSTTSTMSATFDNVSVGP